MSIKITKFLAKSTIVGLFTFHGYHAFYDFNAPEPVDFKALKDKPKRIVIVGTGLAGLLASYYLATDHPNNKIIMLERWDKPYQGTSFQNGNWLTNDYSKTWVNWPMYPKVYRALFDSEEHASKIYVESAFKDFGSFLIMAKFSYKWAFYQPTFDQFATTSLSLKKTSKILLDQIVAREGISESEYGYINNSSCLLFQNSSDYTSFTNKCDKFYPGVPIR